MELEVSRRCRPEMAPLRLLPLPVLFVRKFCSTQLVNSLWHSIYVKWIEILCVAFFRWKYLMKWKQQKKMFGRNIRPLCRLAQDLHVRDLRKLNRSNLIRNVPALAVTPRTFDSGALERCYTNFAHKKRPKSPIYYIKCGIYFLILAITCFNWEE